MQEDTLNYILRHGLTITMVAIPGVPSLGHDKKDYSDPVYRSAHIQGLQYVASQVKTLESNKAYADSRDNPVRSLKRIHEVI
jgi:hypothetical protein